MKARARPRRRVGSLLAGVAALMVAVSGATATAQAGDPILYDVTPPLQLTLPDTQVQITFTISDFPPCADGDVTTLDTLDFELSDPSSQSTIASFSDSEPAGTVSGNLSPDMTALTLLFDSAIPCENPAGASPPNTESITVVVTLDVPAGVPLGTQLSLQGRARGFAAPPNADYAVDRTGVVLVAEPLPPPPPPPPPPPGPGDGGGGAAEGGANSVAGTAGGVAATAVIATPRFTG